ncbi:MAG: response regulator [Actinobacteria bacterium]|nr:response regulator [Actinomycetota bacterium]
MMRAATVAGPGAGTPDELFDAGSLEEAIRSRIAASEVTSGPIRILLVEDDEDDYIVTSAMLDDAERITVELSWAESAEQARRLVADGDYDLLLVDHRLGVDTGLEFVRQAMEDGFRGPSILLTGVYDGRIDDDALDAGVSDYLVKDTVDAVLLERSIRYALQHARFVEELERVRVRQIELKDRFLSHVSHELRTPIAAVYQFVTILLDGLAGELDDEQREYLGIVLRNVAQLGTMVDDLLEATRTQTGKLQATPVRASAATMLSAAHAEYEQQAADRGVTLSVDCPEDLPVQADPARVHQVLANLLNNALRFTPPAGSIEITCERHDDLTAVVSVVDTGPGIDARDVERIFDRLGQVPGGGTTTDSRRGLGLGLFICRQLVDLHGGRIWVDSTPGEGSAFRFTLPLWSLARCVAPAVTRSLATGGPLVLVRLTLNQRNRSTERRRRIRTLAGQVVDRATLPYDVMLPAVDEADDVIHLLAPIPKRNVATVAARISEALAAHPRLSGVGRRFDFATVGLHPGAAEQSGDDLAEALAARVDELIGSTAHGHWHPIERTTHDV